MDNYLEDFEDYSDNFPDDYIDMSQFAPKDGLILYIMDKHGTLEDMIIGLNNIKKYISKL